MSSTPFSNLAYMELLYSNYRRDPQSVSAEWQRYFAENLDNKKNGESRLAPSFAPRSIFNPATPSVSIEGRPDPRTAGVHERLYELIRNYRVRGHMIASINPLGAPRPQMPDLELD
jgi:2-oxoglutarate dehydrogenase E1 component